MSCFNYVLAKKSRLVLENLDKFLSLSILVGFSVSLLGVWNFKKNFDYVIPILLSALISSGSEGEDYF